MGQLLRQARQEAGLSQRALCGDRITRNMLSQIENGTARPSMATLQYLADALGKPVSYFLGETVLTDNQQLMALLRTTRWTGSVGFSAISAAWSWQKRRRESGAGRWRKSC